MLRTSSRARRRVATPFHDRRPHSVESRRGGGVDGAPDAAALEDRGGWTNPDAAEWFAEADDAGLGDRDYSSALPAMQQLNPRVAQIFVDFE